MGEQPNRRPNERVDFICKTRYGNQLPDLPFEPKFLQAPFVSLSRFVEYKPTSLEKNYKYELLTEPDLNVKIDLIDPMTYYFDPDNRPLLHPKDEKLLEDENVSQQNFKRSLQHSKVVPFMRKTEYISTEFNRYGVGADRQESKIGYGTRKKFAAEHSNYKDRDTQMTAIERTFEDVKKPVKKHYSKPGVHAVSETPIFPDFDMWGFAFAQVVFDSDPLPLCKAYREEKLSQAVLRGMMDSEGNQFVGYFSPVEAAIVQKTEDNKQIDSDSVEVMRDGPFEDGFEYEYQLEREYTWTVKNKATAGYEQENYFFVIRGNRAYYNELESRVRLVRRPKSQSSKNSLLFIKYRPTSSKETKSMDSRLRHLMYPLEAHDDNDEEEEYEEEEESEEQEREPEQCSQESDKISESKAQSSLDSDEEEESKNDDESDDDRPQQRAAANTVHSDENDNDDESGSEEQQHHQSQSAQSPDQQEEEGEDDDDEQPTHSHYQEDSDKDETDEDTPVSSQQREQLSQHNSADEKSSSAAASSSAESSSSSESSSDDD